MEKERHLLVEKHNATLQSGESDRGRMWMHLTTAYFSYKETFIFRHQGKQYTEQKITSYITFKVQNAQG